MNTETVRSYYAGIGEREWARLENPDDGAIEFEVTCQVLVTCSGLHRELFMGRSSFNMCDHPTKLTHWLDQFLGSRPTINRHGSLQRRLG